LIIERARMRSERERKREQRIRINKQTKRANRRLRMRETLEKRYIETISDQEMVKREITAKIVFESMTVSFRIFFYCLLTS